MNNKSTKVLQAGVLALIPALLTSCPRPDPYQPPVQLSFSLPDAATQVKNLKLAALYYETAADGTLTQQVLPGTYGSYISGTTASLSLDAYALKSLAANARCVQPFKTNSTTGMKDITVTPDSVKVCNLYFIAFEDSDGNGEPVTAEERYITHDMYAYASEAFRYSMTTSDGSSTESGQRTQGWSLVRHLVLEPSATPGKYQVTMNSVPTEDQAITIRLHEPTDFMTSMNLPAQKPGGLK